MDYTNRPKRGKARRAWDKFTKEMGHEPKLMYYTPKYDQCGSYSNADFLTATKGAGLLLYDRINGERPPQGDQRILKQNRQIWGEMRNNFKNYSYVPYEVIKFAGYVRAEKVCCFARIIWSKLTIISTAERLSETGECPS